jgi:Spy/CpxP family protein refolding chaperone
MRFRTIFTAIALAASLAFDAAAGEGHGRKHGPPPIDRVLDRHAEELGLDDAVLEQVRAIGARARAEEEPLRETLRAQRDELHELLRQDAPDTDAVMRQAEEIGSVETELHKARLRTLLEVRTLLTPEQRAKLESIFEEKRQRMRDRWKDGGDAPPEPGPPPE